MYVADMPPYHYENCKGKILEAMPPLATVLFSYPDLRTNHADVEYSEIGCYDGNGRWCMQRGNYFGVRFNKPNSNAVAYVLRLDHETVGDARISIFVNYKELVSGFSTKEGVVDRFDVTEYLQEGSNRIDIRFDGDAEGAYLIQCLSVYPRDNKDFLIRP